MTRSKISPMCSVLYYQQADSVIVSGPDVCLFCALRPTYQTIITRSFGEQCAARAYNTATSRRSPAGASVAQPKDQDEDEDAPMLKQNASLLNSFPFQRQRPQATPSQQLSTSPSQPGSSQGFETRPKEQRDRVVRSIPNRESQFRINYRQARTNPDRGPSSQQLNQAPQTGSEGTISFEPFASHKRLQLDNPPESGVRHRGYNNRRVFLNRDFDESNNDTNGTRQPQALSDRFAGQSGGEKRGFFRQGDHSNASTSDIRSARRRFNKSSDTSVQEASNYNKHTARGSDYGSWTAASPSNIGPNDGTIEGVDASAGTRFNTGEEIGGFEQRRKQREDKRKSRASRFEDEEDTVRSSNSDLGRSLAQPTSRGSVRGNRFDYEMAEVEEALYGGDSSRRSKKGRNPKTMQQTEVTRPTIRLSEFMSVGQLASALGVQLDPFVRKLEEEGFEGARYDHILDAQTSAMFADLYGFDPLIAEPESSVDLVARPLPEDVSALPPRPPIVTIMGHVDHGKTTILDYLRKSSVVATEHGGITQHIGAFSVMMPGSNRQITFLDTPGHAAFLEMRRRGANVTDIVVLVVAADDSVKPQTIEAIKHAIEAKVQIIVAINKVDKDDANIERVKQDLTRHEIVVEDYGGDYQAIPVSGKTGQGMAELEEAILTLADVHDFRAENDGPAEGTIIESTVTAGGRVATVLVRRGTLRPGDFIVAGATWARVRTLRNDVGVLVTEAPPGTPVQVDGWRGEDPSAGLEVLQAEDEAQAKDVVDYRLEQRESMRASVDMTAINETRSEEAEARAKVRAWEAQQEWAKKSYGLQPKDNAGWVEPATEGGPTQVHFVVKADVAGSVEAVVAAVTSVGNNEIVANVIHSGTGPLIESDIKILAATGEPGYAISFNQPVEGAIARLAEAAELQILDHNIIYKVTDVVKEKLAERLPPIVTQKVLGEAEVGQIFEVTIKKAKTKIAGCKVTNGTVSRANKIRVQRGGQVVYTGTLNSLKNVKKDVTEMRKGTECGMGFQDWDDFREGDQIQCFEEHEERRTLY